MAVKVATEKALKNAVASMEMEGFRFTQAEIDRIKDALEKNLTPSEFLKIVLNSFKED